MDEQAKINKDTVTKFKAIYKVLENIDSKVTEVRSSNHQVLNMMKMHEMQVGQLVGCLSANEGKLPGQPKGPEMAKAIQTRPGKETEDPEHSAGAKIGTGKGLTCGPSLVRKHHSVGNFPQSIR
jgi:hypothetical protein